MEYMRGHMSVSLEGMLRNYNKKSMAGFFLDDKGNEMSDKECRDYIAQCQTKGWKKIPMCDESECPDLDHFENGCPVHEITKEEYEKS